MYSSLAKVLLTKTKDIQDAVLEIDALQIIEKCGEVRNFGLGVVILTCPMKTEW